MPLELITQAAFLQRDVWGENDEAPTTIVVRACVAIE